MKKRVIKPIIILIVLILLALLVWWLVRPAYQAYRQQQCALLQEKIQYYEQEQRLYEDFLISTQLPSGAYATHPYGSSRSASLNPYFACYNAIGLMASQGIHAADSVREYFDWHFAHLNTLDHNGLAGTIYDYTATVADAGVVRENSSGSYDSTDSYAALFLWALSDYVELTGDAAYALSHTDEIILVIQVILATQFDGLCSAKPDYPVFYLMDNSEVSYGLLRANALINAVFAEASPEQRDSLRACQLDITALLDVLPARIDSSFWNWRDEYYWPSLQKDSAGKITLADYDPAIFYPDAVSQMFPIAVQGATLDADRAKLVYEKFCDNFAWQTLSHVKNGEADFYWGMLAYCAALQGDEERLAIYLEAVKSDMRARPNALFNADAAWIARACDHMQDVHQAALDHINFYSFIGEHVLPNLFSR